ncbi:MAG: glycerol-3-phosphate 1-O-acyltransferase PlsY [Ignavibacteriae bacterium]|nr:glycerol-3-phosphate 1-O-acyltransferase PlsY [Ignavibacteriota bacterium]MCB0725107.1 glycerol-3-phosphate 1-O-acyltransferase PlsY [Ignavibacteriota bacterium]MCB9242569.1 glycerol-3-phosphate 1-O-acyltransferase PlsY [Ignavibacteriales bacterium]
MTLGVLLIASYLVGSIPFALIIGKVFKGIDVRNYGSGNLGSTNAIRTLGLPLGLLVQILDIAKGLVVVLIVSTFFYDVLPFKNQTPFEDITLIKIMAGSAAVIGHTFSVFANFKGGKGINTGLGVFISLAPVDVLLTVGVFLLILISSGYVSLGSIIAAVFLPIIMFIRENFFDVGIYGYNTLIFFTIAVSVFIIYNHRTNIKRLLYGNENQFKNLWLIRLFKIKTPLKP